jgi:hypothetical protein
MSGTAAISKLRSRYLLLRWAETILFGLSVAAVVGAIEVLFGVLSVIIPATAAVITIICRYYYLGLSSVDDLKIALYLNRFYPELKESGDLLIKDPGSLSDLEQIQLGRISLPQVKLPHKLPIAIMSFFAAASILAIALYLFVSLFVIKGILSPFTQQNISEAAVPPEPTIKSIVVTITPPSYTHLSKTETTNLSFSAPEGSTVTWKFSYDEPISHIKLTMTGGDSLVNSAPTAHNSQLTTILTKSLLYRIIWDQSHSTDYYRIDVKPDQLPHVAIKDLPQFTRLSWGQKRSIEVTSSVSDDYGLTEAHIIATVSKGSGESVKFREEKLAFISPSKISGANIIGKLTLDFKKLGMDPGDEVYFYVEAFDNKQPDPQRNRTDTYFVALQDTAQQEISMNEGLGVDLMPEYFRSQRQLIIDTEKLLADRKAKKVTKQQFNSTSNELGYDQKVLRLRYGQFLGEEFETNIGESAAEHAEHEEKEEEEKKEADDVLKKFGHQHDKEEQATFFSYSVKAKLRAALTLMWDSELKLRMFEPKESLPTQYQILKLLKEIAQDSRIYVHRMGFDPPPIKEEKRLSGALDEIKPSAVENQATSNYEYPAIRLALSDISVLLFGDDIKPNDRQRTDLHSAGDELAALALKSPGNYLQSLSDLKSIAESKMDSTSIRSKLEEIQKVFWTVLPNEAPSPTQRGAGAHRLDLKFLEEIKSKAND